MMKFSEESIFYKRERRTLRMMIGRSLRLNGGISCPTQNTRLLSTMIMILNLAKDSGPGVDVSAGVAFGLC